MEVSMDMKKLKKVGIGEKSLPMPREPHDGKGRWPVILGDGQYLIAGGIAKGGIDYLKPKCNVLYRTQYFTWEKSYEGAAVYDSIPSAIESVAKGQKLELKDDVPVGLYHILSDKFDVSIEEGAGEIKKVNLYKAEGSAVEEGMGKVDSSIKKTALEIVKGLNLKTEEVGFMEGLFSKGYEIFAPLQLALGEVDSVLCSSPVNVGALTGMKLQDIEEGTYAIYSKNTVYILTPKELDYGHIFLVARDVNIEDTLGDLLTGLVGVEEEDLKVRDYKRIKNKSIGITNRLREWREVTAYLDLPFYIIGAYITTHSQDRALEYLQNNLGITEMQFYHYYKNCVEDIANSLNLPLLSVGEWFTLIHSGDRTLFPSTPTDHTVTAKSNSVKIDSGIIVLHKGVLRAVSDVARTLPLSKEAKVMYEILKKTVKEVVIPSISAGKRACDVYKETIDRLKESFGEIKASGLMPEGESLDEFDRDFGHTLDRETAVTIFLHKGNTRFLKEAMIGCAEIHWPYKGHAIGFEDSWIAGADKGINFTS